MEFQEPQAKRRRVDIAYTASENTWQSSGPPHGYVQPQNSSSDFSGTGVSNNNGSFNVGGNLYLNHGNTANTASESTAGREELLDSLGFEQIESRQLSIKKAHEKTCRWFLKDPIYKQWEQKALSQGSDNLLWIKGKPGAGKSTLMNFLDKQLRSQLSKKEKPCDFISFFFNARGSDLEKSIEGMYRSLLLQLLKNRPELQHVLDRLRSVPQWDMNLLKHLFERAAEELTTTTICLIDALDECQGDEIEDMVDSFESILRAGGQLHVCFASRHYPHVSTKIGLNITLEEQVQHENDISSYLNTKLDIGDSKQAEEIRLEMREKASGVFMWVVLVVKMLNKEYNKGKIPNLRKRLRQIPSDLHELFHSILIRDNEDRDELLLCIQWVLFAKEPLTPKQLYFAIISGSDPLSLLDYHSDEIAETDMQRYILNSSKGLTEPTKSKKTPTVQFIHESVRDFLLKGDGFHKVFPDLPSNINGSSHEKLKTCCLKYIEMDKGYDINVHKSDVASSKYPFLSYAIKGILYHANEAASNGLNQKKFLTEFPHVTWVTQYNALQHKRRRYDSQVSMLYILAEAGATSLIDALPNIQSCFDVEGSCFGLPIVCAVVLKNFDCAQEMLRVQAKRVPGFCYEEFLKFWSPVLAISDGLKPFNNSHTFRFDRSAPRFREVARFVGELVSIFYLQTESFNVHTEDQDGYTAMMVATENGYGHLLKELHQRGADFNAIILKDGRTALHLAVQNCRPVAVQQLINLGVDVSVVDSDKLSLLHYLGSAKLGPEINAVNIARLLIDNGARVSCIDTKGKTPLHTVSKNRHGCELAKLLLDCGANIAAADHEGRTPLHIWCLGDYQIRYEISSRSPSKYQSISTVPVPEEYLNVGRLLLNRGGDVASIDKYGKTPLHYCDSRETAELLLDHNAFISAIDTSGDTPLHCAARYYEPYLCQLLLRRGADPMAVNIAREIPFDLVFNKSQYTSMEDWVKRRIEIFSS